jgi:hypothetical protein
VGRVLGAAEPGLDQCEAGLHEDHQDGADHDPQQVGLLAQRIDRRDRVGIGILRAGDRGRQQDGGAGYCETDPYLPPERHAGSRTVTRAK